MEAGEAEGEGAMGSGAERREEGDGRNQTFGRQAGSRSGNGALGRLKQRTHRLANATETPAAIRPRSPIGAGPPTACPGVATLDRGIGAGWAWIVRQPPQQGAAHKKGHPVG